MILFRVDGNSQIGLGHVMRCLSIADVFKNRGHVCVFVIVDNSAREIIANRGHKVIAINPILAQMDDELSVLISMIHDNNFELVIVDSYFVTDQYMKVLRRECKSNNSKLVYIDDLLTFPYDCDVLINYNIYANIAAYEKLYDKHELPVLMIGTKYAPLRSEFRDIKKRFARAEGENILISTGGADAEHISAKLIKTILKHKEWEDLVFHFVIGAMNADKECIASLVEGSNNIKMYINCTRMNELMMFCDAAISAAGSTLYELCATQTPTVTYILADNQIKAAKEFEKKGILSCAGDCRELGITALAERSLSMVVTLSRDYEKKTAAIHQMRSIVDGLGAERIVTELA